MSQVNRKRYWKSLQDKAGRLDEKAIHEFPQGATQAPSHVDRRDFFKIMGASLSLAGLTGCGFRKPEQEIFPYVAMPEELIPGRALFYATSMAIGSDVTGLLVESHEGRPTKIEGNPAHPQSLGKTNHWHQASVLDLYDPDRLQKPKVEGKVKSKTELISLLKAKNLSKGQAILHETLPSPTFKRLLAELKRKNPGLSIYKYDSVNRDNIASGIMLASGERQLPLYSAKKASIVVGFGMGIGLLGDGNVANSLEVTSRRAPESKAGMNRIYAVESGFSPLGGLADHRIQVRHLEIKYVLGALVVELEKKGMKIPIPTQVRGSFNAFAGRAAAIIDPGVIKAMASDLLKHKSRSLVCAGPSQPSTLHAIVYALNHALRNNGHTVSYQGQEGTSSLESIRALCEGIDSGDIRDLFILGGNPVYAAPADMHFAEKLKKINATYLTSHENETSALTKTLIPKSHYLESWGDLESLDGTLSPVQPLISPIYESLSEIELLAVLNGESPDGHKSIQKTHGLSAFSWRKWLHEGVGLKGRAPVSGAAAKLNDFSTHFIKEWGTKPVSQKEKELVFCPDFSVYDGRFSNNGWLQEMPDPVSKLTWDNALFVSPLTAENDGVKSGDLVSIRSGKKALEVVVDILPGLAKNSYLLHLGYGTQYGRVGKAVGYRAESLRTTANLDAILGIAIEKSAKRAKLANVQNHNHLAPDDFGMEERPLYLETNKKVLEKGFSALRKQEGFNKLVAEKDADGNERAFGSGSLRSLWKEREYNEDMADYQWGMTIDLSKCTACGTCTLACQAENNIPIVGKEQVLKGREMHWIRVDRYFAGDVEKPDYGVQPVTCQQCENAPCEQVCPVAATVHSKEGLNDMVYNRCIGTRYCSNNCPYKVRRFNFLIINRKILKPWTKNESISLTISKNRLRPFKCSLILMSR